MFDNLSSPEIWIGLATLSLMEVVLGIDNIIFVSIISSSLPSSIQSKARFWGLIIACIMRLALLSVIGWIISLSQPLFELFGHSFSGRDITLLSGGIFLVYKATKEIYNKVEGDEDHVHTSEKKSSFASAISQIALLNLVFSIDSIVTAIGMTKEIFVMVASIIISMSIMIIVGKPVGDFVMKHPSVKMLALAFLLMIGTSLVAESFHKEIPKGYIYSAMAFSVLVEMLNLLTSRKKDSKLSHHQ